MDDPIFKKKYQKYKLRVKIWEKNFKKKHNRIPSKYDIRDAPLDIRESYKMYYKLKTSFLETTLNDVLSEDGFDILENSQDDFTDTNSNCPRLPLDMSSISNIGESDPIQTFSNINELESKTQLTNVININEHHIIKEFEPIKEDERNLKAWGSDVSKKPPPKKEPSPVRKSFKPNLNAKLFSNSSFSKRNPRKSLARPNRELSHSMSFSSLSEPIDTKDILPDYETILNHRSKELITREPSNDSLKLESDLNKNTHSEVVLVQFSQTKLEPSIPTTPISFQLASSLCESERDNQLVAKSQEITRCMAVHDSDSVVSNSEDENETREYRHIAKRRRVLTTIDKNRQQITDFEKKTSEKVSPCPTEELKLNDQLKIEPVNERRERRNRKPSSSEDDTYKTSKTKNARKKAVIKKGTKAKPVPKKPAATRRTRLSKKQQAEINSKTPEEDEEELVAPDPSEIKNILALEAKNLTCLPRVNVDDLTEVNMICDEYVNKTTDLKVIPAPGARTIVNEKKEADRNKLMEKMASGKLNENFVRINIQKKVFVRGRKTVNYSKYKKKLWRQKKASALTGPEMDMGGCDGGVLICFQCGEPGHFAQQCKMKTDTLLPINVEIDEESPHLTLEEAEKLAEQNAVAVHSKNLSKLPEASNCLLYKKEEEKSDNMEPECESEVEDNLEPNVQPEVTEEPSKIELPSQPMEVEMDSEITKSQDLKTYVGHKIPEDFLRKAGLLNDSPLSTEIGPLYDLNPDGSVKQATDEVYDALRMFGHTAFRKGQDRAIMRILSGQSTLVTLSTGSGKSLCYQLPAYLYSKKKHFITLVISPLVSLMEDQVHGVPHFLRAHCLHTNQTPQQRLKVLELINSKEIDILLVSPEAVVAGERSSGFGSILRKLPPIAFACIDEAHCVSQWSHNFRPSYLMICKVLKKNLGVKTVLGLTATATLPTRQSIIRHLAIPDGERGIISDVPLPNNLILSISKDENRDVALIELLCSKRFDSCQSIIIYCTRRDECERIAGFIRTYMQDRKSAAASENETKKKRKRVNWQAEAYHAGLPASRRRTIQNAFMKNELRIVVATIAFGMGINKPDIRSVIHYNMPRNFESYVQEIGRAGRDGKISHCHLFLDAKGNDQSELRRHIYANSIDRHVIRKLLLKVFVPCSCAKNLKKSEFVKEHEEEIRASQDINWNEDVFDIEKAEEPLTQEDKLTSRKRVCPGHEIGFSVEKTVQALDIPEENISTLLCYLELDCRWGINVLSSAYTMCKVVSYGGPKYIKHAAKNCPPLAMAVALQLKNKTFKEESNVIEFSVIDIAAAIGWNSGVVKYQLKNLEWISVDGYSKRSPITVSFSDLGFRVNAPGDFTLDEIDDALDALYNRSLTQEKTQLIQLQFVSNGLASVAYKTYQPCTLVDYPHDRSDKLKSIIRDYFENDYPNDLTLEEEKSTVPDEAIIGDIYSMIGLYPDNTFSGRNIARIFHGIPSPNYPAVIWGRCKYWRAHSRISFNRIVQLANSVILKMRA